MSHPTGQPAGTTGHTFGVLSAAAGIDELDRPLGPADAELMRRAVPCRAEPTLNELLGGPAPEDGQGDTYTPWYDRLNVLFDGTDLTFDDWPDDEGCLREWHAEGLTPQRALDRLIEAAETSRKAEEAAGEFLGIDFNPEPQSDPVDIKLRLALDLLPRVTKDRWREQGATDATIREQLGTWWGLDGRRNDPVAKSGGYHVRGGTHPAFWDGDLTPKGKGDSRSPEGVAKPTLQGPALVARVRRVLSIPNPTKARGIASLQAEIRREGREAAAAIEATPAQGEGWVEAHERVNQQIRDQRGINRTRKARARKGA